MPSAWNFLPDVHKDGGVKGILNNVKKKSLSQRGIPKHEQFENRKNLPPLALLLCLAPQPLLLPSHRVPPYSHLQAPESLGWILPWHSNIPCDSPPSPHHHQPTTCYRPWVIPCSKPGACYLLTCSMITYSHGHLFTCALVHLFTCSLFDFLTFWLVHLFTSSHFYLFTC